MNIIYKSAGVTAAAIAAILVATAAAAAVPSPGPNAQDSPLDRKSGGPILPPEKRVLTEGTPPLTEDMAMHYAEFVTWVLEIDITPTDRDRFRAMIIKDWTGPKRQADIASDMQALAAQEELAKQPSLRELFRQRTMPGVVKELKQKAAAGDADAQWLLGRYQMAHQPIAAGNPPLTPQIAAASAEMICFMASEARGHKVNVTPAFKASARKTLVSRYGALSASQKREMAGLPLLWAELQAAWPSAPEKDRENLRVSWREQFGDGSQVASAPPQTTTSGSDYAFSMEEVWATKDSQLLPAPPTGYLRNAADSSDVEAAKARAAGDQSMAAVREREAKRLRELAAMPRDKRPRLTKRQLMAMPLGKIPVEYRSVRNWIQNKDLNVFSNALIREQHKHIGNMGLFSVYREIL